MNSYVFTLNYKTNILKQRYRWCYVESDVELDDEIFTQHVKNLFPDIANFDVLLFSRLVGYSQLEVNSSLLELRIKIENEKCNIILLKAQFLVTNSYLQSFIEHREIRDSNIQNKKLQVDKMIGQMEDIIEAQDMTIKRIKTLHESKSYGCIIM